MYCEKWHIFGMSHMSHICDRCSTRLMRSFLDSAQNLVHFGICHTRCHTMMSLCDDIIFRIPKKFVTFWYLSHYVMLVTSVTKAPVSLSVTPWVFFAILWLFGSKKGWYTSQILTQLVNGCIHRYGQKPMDITIITGLGFNGYNHYIWAKAYSYRWSQQQ
jgi:hypothetical protein